MEQTLPCNTSTRIPVPSNNLKHMKQRDYSTFTENIKLL